MKEKVRKENQSRQISVREDYISKLRIWTLSLKTFPAQLPIVIQYPTMKTNDLNHAIYLNNKEPL